MKKIFTLFLALCATGAFAQSTIYMQTFNTGTATDWSLNTSDLGGVPAVGNQWVINNVYAAGTLGTPTANEPAGITGGPTSYYMHINCGPSFSSFYGLNCNFLAGGTGETYFAAQNTAISTVGYTNVTFSFWWLCQGDATSIGDVYYRTSAGGTWTAITALIPTPNLYGSSVWTRDSIHLAAFDGQAYLEFGFQFTDGSSAAGSDPAFGVDDIMVTGTGGTTGAPVITTNPSNATVCTGGSTLFTAVATGATSYQWQRSTTGIAGPFVNITAGMDGGIYGTSYTTATLTITSPTITENGYAYQLVATNGSGSVTSTPATLTVNTATVAAISGPGSLCVGTTGNLTDATPGGTWTASNGNATVSASGVVTGVAAGTDVISYTVTGPCGTATATFNVTITTSATAGTIAGSSTLCIGANDTLTDGISGGTWSSMNGNATVSASGVVTGVAAGTDVISYTVTSSCGTATVTFNITITTGATASAITGIDSVCVSATSNLADATTGGTWTSMNANATVSASGVVTGVTPGTDVISYTVTSSCGTATVSVNVTVKPVPHPVINRSGHTLSVAGTYSSYQWVLGGSNILGATNSSYIFSTTGSYQVTVDSGGCYGTSVAHTYNLSVNELTAADNSYGITQSGTTATLYATLPLADNMYVNMYDAMGRLVYHAIWSDGATSMQFSVGNLASGLYIIKLNAPATSSVIKWMKL